LSYNIAVSIARQVDVTETSNAAPLPAGLEKILKRFATLSPDMTRQALVQYAHKLPPLPERFRDLDPEQYKVHECMTPVAIFPEVVDGRMYFHADVPQAAPTIRALLAMLFEALNGQPPTVTLAIPQDFVPQVMSKLGLGTREVGLNAIVERLRRAARAAEDHGGPGGGPAGIGA
jgi:cysteine desulfuration protein SufE